MFFTQIVSKHFKSCLLIVGPFFFISKDGVIGKTPRLREEAFLEVQWQSRRPTIAVLDLPSSFMAIILTFSATESLPIHLVIFYQDLVKKFC